MFMLQTNNIIENNNNWNKIYYYVSEYNNLKFYNI